MVPKLQDELFEAVRARCKPAVWSRAVELNRADDVHFDKVEEDAAIFRISLRRGMMSRAVTLFLDEIGWECECPAADAGCEHVAAAVICWRRAEERGEPPSRAGAPGRVAYRFTRDGRHLALTREIVVDGAVHPLESTLNALAAGRVAGPRFVASQGDLAVELALATHRRGRLPAAVVDKLLARLVHCDAVTLDGEPVAVSPEPVRPRVIVEDHGSGFLLRLVQDPDLVERFVNGIGLCGGALRPLGHSGLNAREREDYLRGRVWSGDEVGALVSDVLPALRRRVPVEVRTDRLPDREREPPAIRIETEREGETLRVLATLVYGDPPRARIDAGRLVHLEGTVPVRDVPAEKGLLRRLQRELHLAPGARAEVSGIDAVTLAGRLADWSGSVVGESHRFFDLAAPLEPRIAIEGGRFDVAFESPAGAGRSRAAGQADTGRVLRAWRDGEPLVPLLEGGWAPLPADWLERHGHRLADLLAARGDDGTLPSGALPDLVRLCEELDRPAPPELSRLRPLIDGFDGLPATEPPPDLTAELRPYQRHGVDWLAFMRRAGLGALLADDMGLGKTLQALCVVSGRTLVVAPTSVLHNWADEAARFRPTLRCSVYHGPRRSLDETADLTLTTYAILRLDADALASVEWDTVVLDEAQAIKNPDSLVAGAAFRLAARSRITLTGTPVENRLDELWSQFHFLNRGLLGGRSDFQERYAAPIAAGEPGAAARLRERIRPFVLRRLKQQVAPELPPRTDMVLYCELDEREREVYETIRLATLEEVVKKLETGGGVLAALEALLRLRQAACHTALIPGQDAERSSKLELLWEALDNVVAEGHRALVFSQWTSLLDLIEPGFAARGWAHVRLDGATRDRAAVVRRFQDEDGPPLMLVSLKAGGTGLNLTAADHVFLLDPWWNPAVEDQAADRAHRIGQQRPVMVYRLVAEGTVEERILELQRRKRELADAALGEAAAAAGLTREDLLSLLS